MSDSKSTYPWIGTGHAYRPDMNDEIVKKFIKQNFTKGSAILEIKYYCPKNLIVQLIPFRERVKKTQTNRMRNGFIVDTSASVDIQQIVKNGGKVIEIYEGVFYRDSFI